MRKDNILITGTTGFIGFNLAKSLARNDKYNIIAIVRAGSDQEKAAKLKKLNVKLVQGCFYENDCVVNIFDSVNVDYVIHCAALTGAGLGKDSDYQKVNVFGTEILLKNAFAKSIKKFIFCSSVGVWGTIPRELPATLETPLNPDGSYHKSKAAAEDKVLEYAKKGLNAFIVRPTIVYGPGDKGFSRKLADMVKHKKLFFKQNVRIHLINIDKLIETFSKIIEKDNQGKRIFIAADKTEVFLKEIVNLLSMRFHGKNYPECFIFPEWVFDWAKLCFTLVRNDKWMTRIRLLSEDWFYDGSEANEFLGVDPVSTKECFVKQVLTADVT